MSRVDKNKKLRPSILDRLLDDAPEQRTENDPGLYQRIQQLRSSVRRDLESLFNTRHRVIEPGEHYPEAEHSLLNYGLPDLAIVNIIDVEKRRLFTKNLERVLKDFEPRFKSVKIEYLDNTDMRDRSLRFRINATLYADPIPELVVFDSILEPVTRAVNIENES